MEIAESSSPSRRERLQVAKAEWTQATADWLWRDDARGGILEALFRTRPSSGPLSRQLDLMAAAAAQAAGRRVVDGRMLPARLRQMIRRGAAPIAIVGDSHSRLYARRGRASARWLAPVHHLATGASARGLGNPTSRLGQGEAVRRFVARLAALEQPVPVLFVFGQVDVEFVFAFKRLELDASAPFDPAAFADFCDGTAEDYAAFVASLGLPPGLATLAGIFPPVLSDAAWRAGYVNAQIASEEAQLPLESLRARLARAEVPDLASRTAQHRFFNAALARAAGRRGLGYIEAFDHLVGEGGVVRPAFAGRSAGLDHHLDLAAVGPVVVPILAGLVSGSPHDRF